MPMYRVYLYPILTVTVDNVEAADPAAAVEKAEQAAERSHRFDRGGVSNRTAGVPADRTPCLVEYTQYTDALDGALVQEWVEDTMEPVREIEFDSSGKVFGDTGSADPTASS